MQRAGTVVVSLCALFFASSSPGTVAHAVRGGDDRLELAEGHRLGVPNPPMTLSISVRESGPTIV